MGATQNKFKEKLTKLFEEHGVTNYLFVFKDPDSDETIFATPSDFHWTWGVVDDLFSMIHETREKQQEEA